MLPAHISQEELKMLEAMAKDKNMSTEELYASLNIKCDEPILVRNQPEEDRDITVELGPAPVEEHAIPDLATEAEFNPLPPPAEEVQVPENNTVTAEICVQCGWNQKDVPIEATEKDKLVFLQCFLGQQLFRKQYSILGGKVNFQFRSLTLKEIDAIYAETFKNKELATTEDFYEHVNRLRLILQLTRFSAVGSTIIDLPEGLNEATNRSAKTHWEPYLRNMDKYDDNKSLLANIQEYVTENVIFSESMQRTAYKLCSNFNILLGRLEASVVNENFWKTTEQQL